MIFQEVRTAQAVQVCSSNYDSLVEIRNGF